MRPPSLTTRRGSSLVELLIGLTVLGIIGSASVRLLLSQTRFYDVQLKQRSARSVARASVNLMLSELRMVESTAGVEAASANSVTVRIPYAMGMFCGSAGGVSVVALLPADSTVMAGATPSGHAWRGANGVYTYTNGTVSVSAGGTATCTANNISAVPGGTVVTMSPALPAGASAGDVAFLYQRIRFDFASSTVLPGRRALWRTVVDSDTHEELAAPFDNSARFRFYQFDRDTSDVSAAAADIRGLELVLDGASQTAAQGRPGNEAVPFRTSVFFNNRVN
jgi:type II secretory pathway pseudopilin PulG